MNDWQLLEQYATENSEAAFRELVGRYVGMVYHAALRQTGNPHTAEEVAQVVFITLAQKAGVIPRQATLYGWLFRATRFAVLNEARKNAHRQRREQEALTMQPITASDETESLWERIAPHLNEALDKLSAADREAVMIRYFGNKSHKEVGEALGVSEDTARKRLSRALERLRAIFARNGVAVSSLALAAALAAHGAKAAPVELALSLAKAAMANAAAGAGATAGGMSAMGTLAKVPVLISALVGVMAVVVATVVVRHTRSHETRVAAVSLPSTPAAPVAPVAPSKPAVVPTADAAPFSALDHVKAALHDPNPTDVYPSSVMREAIAVLGDNKKVALPILEAALNDADEEVRLRAVDGLGIIGPQAGPAATALLAVIRAGGVGEAMAQVRYTVTEFNGAIRDYPIYANNIILYTLALIAPGPETTAELARAMKENGSACNIVYQTTTQFGGPRRRLQAGGWLFDIAGGNARVLNRAFEPLLRDPDRMLRVVAACALVSALGDQADPRVFPVAAELLTGGDAMSVSTGMNLLQGAARDKSSDSPMEVKLYAPRLGPYLNETVSALAGVAYHATRENTRLKASGMLEVLVPEFRQDNPTLAGELEQQSQSDDFVLKVMAGAAAPVEVLAGLKKFPKAAPAVASYYARSGSNAVDLLPAFAEALSALHFTNDDRAAGIRLRQRLADAMQQLAPNQPKPIFTGMDAAALTRIMNQAALQDDPSLGQRITVARQFAGWPTNGATAQFDASPAQIRRLLLAVKDADAPTYDALATKVKEIDPHFSGEGK